MSLLLHRQARFVLRKVMLYRILLSKYLCNLLYKLHLSSSLRILLFSFFQLLSIVLLCLNRYRLYHICIRWNQTLQQLLLPNFELFLLHILQRFPNLKLQLFYLQKKFLCLSTFRYRNKQLRNLLLVFLQVNRRR